MKKFIEPMIEIIEIDIDEIISTSGVPEPTPVDPTDEGGQGYSGNLW